MVILVVQHQLSHFSENGTIPSPLCFFSLSQQVVKMFLINETIEDANAMLVRRQEANRIMKENIQHAQDRIVRVVLCVHV